MGSKCRHPAPPRIARERVVHGSDLTAPTDPIRVRLEVEGGGAMPKRYRIEMTLLDDASNTVLDTDSDTVTYDDEDPEAKRAFAKKVKAARDTEKGSSSG
jgi:hypothetical protein